MPCGASSEPWHRRLQNAPESARIRSVNARRFRGNVERPVAHGNRTREKPRGRGVLDSGFLT